MKSILILIGFICVAGEDQLPQCSLVQEHFDSVENCRTKGEEAVVLMKKLDIKHYTLSCKQWHIQEQHSLKL